MAQMAEDYRTEKDALGPVRGPGRPAVGRADGAVARELPDRGGPLPLGAARGPRPRRAQEVLRPRQRRTGQLPPEKVDLIVRAAQEVIDGRWDAEFPLVVFQTGSGTQSNMNANEVIANRAIQLAGGELGSKSPIHPNDDVNRSQSSNDTFPTVMHVALAAASPTADPRREGLRRTFEAKARAFEDVVMIGRTHLQDATPLTLGQAISGWGAQLDHAAAGLGRALEGLYPLAIGGTAVGTGLNAPPSFGEAAARRIAEEDGQAVRFRREQVRAPFRARRGGGRERRHADPRRRADEIANDVRWHACGPRAGFAELLIPENEPGSSIMPGKVNPTQSEALTMVAAQVYGNDAAVAFAGSQGNFQLNVFKPVMLHNALDSALLLADGVRAFDERCARGIEPNRKRIAENLENSLMLVTALNPRIGYENAARIAQTAHREGTSLREAALKLGHVTAEQFSEWVRPEDMTGPLRR